VRISPDDSPIRSAGNLHPTEAYAAPAQAQIWLPRFLLKPGRKYEEAVKTFQLYDRVKDEDPEARAVGKKLIAEGTAAEAKRKTSIYVNNRLEGNALETINAMLQE
jgi:hypothetical protein